MVGSEVWAGWEVLGRLVSFEDEEKICLLRLGERMNVE